MVKTNDSLKTLPPDPRDSGSVQPSSPTTNHRREVRQVCDTLVSPLTAKLSPCDSRQSLLRALRKPAATSYGLRQARQHHTDMKIKLSEATRAVRQTDRDIRDVSTILRRWPTEKATQRVSWTDENGNRQTDVTLSEAETRQVGECSGEPTPAAGR